MEPLSVGIITLLRAALQEEALPIPREFDWEEGVRLLRCHGLTGLALRGAARCGVPHSHPAGRQLTADFCRDAARNRQQTQWLEKVLEAFRTGGIDYLPVKGAVLKSLYPQPALRPMGDADILVRRQQYSRIREELTALGLEEVEESDHEYIWKNAALTVELHKRLVPSYNRDYAAYYGDGWQLAQPVPGSTAHCLRPEDHFLFLLVHFAKDYRDGKPAAKNICDFFVFRRAWPNMEEAYLRRELKKLKLEAFYDHILALLSCWFEGAPATPAVELLTKTTLYGHGREDVASAAAVLRNARGGEGLSGGKGKWILDRLFPSAELLSHRYPVLRKHPVLLPLFWVLRLVGAVLRRSDNIRVGLEETQKLLRVDHEQAKAYEEQLKLVGLAFNPEK